MIYYLCTYPRCGNSFLQQIVLQNLLRLPSQFDAGGTVAQNWIEQWEFRSEPTKGEGWPDGLLWNDFTATYRRKRASSEQVRPENRFRVLCPLGHHQFSEEMREALSREPGHFFIKSHHPPYARYFSGEHVVQVVRHPGPAIWSYYRYLHQISLQKKRKALGVVLDDVIDGNVLFGGWGAYHARFVNVEKQLGSRFLRFDYEDLLRDEAAAGRKLADFCGLQYYASKKTDFAAYDRKMAGFGSRGTNEGYEQYFSARQLSLLWERHGEQASTFGYAPPDLGASCSDDQIRRLSEQVRALSSSVAEADKKPVAALSPPKQNRRRSFASRWRNFFGPRGIKPT